MMRKIFLTLTVILCAGFGVQASASEGTVPLPHQEWPFSGPTGQFDKASMQRGLKVFREVCSACHSLKLVAYRNLADLGYTEDQIKSIAAEYTVIDGPDDDGEIFDRPGRPSDHFVPPYANDKAAVAANGALPPDLSLIIKARHDGPNYVYGLLTGFEEGDHEVPAGKYWNKYFAGHVISMAPPLMDGMVTYEDGSAETLEQYAYDVVNFLNWAADPYMESRKRLGLAVLFFLIVFAGIMYGVKRKIWHDQH